MATDAEEAKAKDIMEEYLAGTQLSAGVKEVVYLAILHVVESYDLVDQ